MSYLKVTTGTWTPTLTGQGTAGTTTYSVQTGQYLKVGNIVLATGKMTFSAATGTGRVLFGGFPFTFLNATERYTGNLIIDSTAWTWQAGRTELVLFARPNETNCDVVGCGSAVAHAFQQMQNVAATWIFTICYRTLQ